MSPPERGRHGDDGDRTAVGQLYGLLVDLRQIRIERAGHRVLRGNLVHTVRDDRQRIGIERHVGEQHQYLLPLVHGEILGGRQRHVGHEQPLHGRVLGRVDERDDAVERAGVLEDLLEVEEVVVREAHAAQDDLVGLGTQRHVGHHGVVGLVGSAKKGIFCPVTIVLLRSMPAMPVAISSEGCLRRKGFTVGPPISRASPLDLLAAFERFAVRR